MSLRTILAAATISAGALIGTMSGASAYVVCNHDGDCWHSDARYKYPDRTYVLHPDDWYFHQDWDKNTNSHWRAEYHKDRGYWRNGVWVTF